MHELGRIFANEWMKLMHRWRLWMVVGLMVLMVIGLSVAIFMEYINKPEHSYTVEKLEKSINQIDQQMQNLQHQLKDSKSDLQSEEIQNNIDYLLSRKDLLQDSQQILSNNWRSAIKRNLEKSNQYLSDEEAKKHKRAYALEKGNQLRLGYQLKQKEGPLPYWERSSYQTVEKLLSWTSGLFLPLLVVILSADMMSDETTHGTIKLLLVRPVSRLKIFFSKWFVSLTATVILVIGFYGLLFLINWAFYGSYGALAPVPVDVPYTFEGVEFYIPSISTATVESIPHYEQATMIPIWQFILTGVCLTMFSMMSVATIIFLCSTLFKSSMISTAVSLALVIVPQLFEIVVRDGKWMIGWLFTVHLNLLNNWTGVQSDYLKTNITLTDGIIVLTIWSLISIVVAAINFNRKEILNG